MRLGLFLLTLFFACGGVSSRSVVAAGSSAEDALELRSDSEVTPRGRSDCARWDVSRAVFGTCEGESRCCDPHRVLVRREPLSLARERVDRSGITRTVCVSVFVRIHWTEDRFAKTNAPARRGARKRGARRGSLGASVEVFRCQTPGLRPVLVETHTDRPGEANLCWGKSVSSACWWVRWRRPPVAALARGGSVSREVGDTVL